MKIWIAGHKGLVGQALMRAHASRDSDSLQSSQRKLGSQKQEIPAFTGITKLLTTDFDLRDQQKTYDWIADNKPDLVYCAAAKVGGIQANQNYPAEFIYNNLAIQNNIIHGCHLADVPRLVFLGSSCIYPRECPQPMREEDLLSGALEPTNAPYAMAKLAGIEMLSSYRRQYGRDYISVLPTNLYGPHDNFHPLESHVPAALLHRIHQAKINHDPQVTIWGSGKPLREFMHVDDLANALMFLADNYHESDPINIGSGQEIVIADFAALMCKTVGYEGELVFDTSKPDGTPRKLLDNSKLEALGWSPSIGLENGLKAFYKWYLANENNLRGIS